MSTTSSQYASMSLEELGGFYSDYHKSFYGFRPRGVNYSDRTSVMQGLAALDATFAQMSSTPTGRQQLRDDGWVITMTPEEEAALDPKSS